MAGRDILIGTLTADGHLATDSGRISLATIAPQASFDPAAAVLEIAPEHVEKTALVRGEMQGQILYRAEVLEIVPALSGALIRTLMDKGLVSLEEIRDHLAPVQEPLAAAPQKVCALVIGHKSASPGAQNPASGLTEFDYNDQLAREIEKKTQKVRVQRVYRRTYRELPDDINQLNPAFVVSLHCNAFNSQATGTEVLFYHTSKKAEQMARILQEHLCGCLQLPPRGIKAKSAEDRGGYLLRYTKAPCVLAEPFFIDNDEDLAVVRQKHDALVAAYARAIDAMGNVV